MATNVEVKNAMFKLKKVLYVKGYNSKTKSEVVGIVTPSYDDYTASIKPNYIDVIGLGGDLLSLRADDVEIKTTRIMDASEREIVDKLIDYAKSLNNVRQEKAKFVSDMKKKEESLNNKIAKTKATISKGIDKLKKKNGYVTESDVKSYLSKYCNIELFNSYSDIYVYRYKDGVELDIRMGGNELNYLRLCKTVDLGKWVDVNSLDFLYLEYDYTMSTIVDLNRSEDFKRLTKKYFRPVDKKVLSGLKAKESYDAVTGDKRSVELRQYIDIYYNTPLTKDALKKLVKDLNVLLKYK